MTAPPEPQISGSVEVVVVVVVLVVVVVVVLVVVVVVETANSQPSTICGGPPGTVKTDACFLWSWTTEDYCKQTAPCSKHLISSWNKCLYM